MGYDGLEGLSDVVGFLVVEQGDVDLLGEGEGEAVALEVLAEVLLQGSDFRHE